ncbi:MAG: Molybdenum cofactor biosynthesis protein B [Candidatus Erwinia impunctatus]|nr:Molybdenum cofactor biosynthesis protein B [Culicoides impunctatus]
MKNKSGESAPLNAVVLTVSDRHTRESDSSGDYLVEALTEAGHVLTERSIVADDRYAIRAIVSRWIASEKVDVILINGGTGFQTKNSTPEAVSVLFDREILGFGELFRMISWEQIGSATLQSRAIAGMANQTLIFAMPGSTSACQLAWQHIIGDQLQAGTAPCNFVTHLRRR